MQPLTFRTLQLFPSVSTVTVVASSFVVGFVFLLLLPSSSSSTEHQSFFQMSDARKPMHVHLSRCAIPTVLLWKVIHPSLQIGDIAISDFCMHAISRHQMSRYRTSTITSSSKMWFQMSRYRTSIITSSSKMWFQNRDPRCAKKSSQRKSFSKFVNF